MITPKVPYRVNDRVHPAALSDVRLKGPIGAKLDKLIENRITSAFAQTEIFGEAERAFYEKIDDQKAPLGLWQGEFWGKLAISAARVCRYKQDDPALKAFLSASAHRILATRREDGYIGTYKNDELIFHAGIADGRRIMGWSCDWNWNLWCRKYTLWGLLEIYQLTEEPEILAGAVRFADQLLATIENLHTRVTLTGTFFGVASGSIMKPMLLLYELTGFDRFLTFCETIADDWEHRDDDCAALIKNALAGKPVHLWNRSILSPEGRRIETTQKAYETMSCFDGILELYRVTGRPELLQAAERFWELLMDYEYNVLFSVGFNDLFMFASSVEDAASEPCDVIHFLRLSSELYKLTADPRYMDVFELAYLNPLQAAIRFDGTWGARCVRGTFTHMNAVPQAGMKYNHCCVDNAPRGFLNGAECAAACDDEGIRLNLFLPAEITLRQKKAGLVHLTVSDGAYQTGRVTVTAACENDTHLFLRLPPWSRTVSVERDGRTETFAPGGIACLPLKAGTNELQLRFELTPVLQEPDYYRGFYPLTPYMADRLCGSITDPMRAHVLKENRAILTVGPMLMALAESENEPWDQSETLWGKHCRVSAEPLAPNDCLCRFRVSFVSDTARVTHILTDYASASDRDGHFTIYL